MLLLKFCLLVIPLFKYNIEYIVWMFAGTFLLYPNIFYCIYIIEKRDGMR